MLYDYQCNNSHCNIQLIDVKQSIHDKPKKRCPHCKSLSLERIITGGIEVNIVAREATTVGQLADHNYKKNSAKVDEANAKKKEETVQPETIYDGGVTRREIQKMTPAQKDRYIRGD